MQDLPFNFIDSEIGLLVGLSLPQITRPLKVVEGPEENSPYATLHKFGWAFNGIVKSNEKQDLKCFKVKIKDKTDDIFMEFCRKDFVDKQPGVLSPSIEDKLWETKVAKKLSQTF